MATDHTLVTLANYATTSLSAFLDGPTKKLEVIKVDADTSRIDIHPGYEEQYPIYIVAVLGVEPGSSYPVVLDAASAKKVTITVGCGSWTTVITDAATASPTFLTNP